MHHALAALVLCLAAASVAAQPDDKPDPGCTWPTQPISIQRSGGSVSILHVKNPTGYLDCKKNNSCKNGVDVKMFKRQADNSDACCYRIDWGEMRVAKSHKDVPIRWKLKSVDSPSLKYEFSANAVDIFAPPLALNDFGAMILEDFKKTAKLISINGRKMDFSYRLAIDRVFPDGTRLACDKADPVIGNQGQ